MLHVLQSICEPGDTRNEDLIWHNDRYAVLLDGSTGLRSTEFDSARFVQEFITAFSASTELGADMCKAINDALACVARHFSETYSTAELAYFPSAAGIFVCEQNDRLEVISIGDCTAHLIMNNGNVMTVSSDYVSKDKNNVSQFDRAVLDRMRDIRAKHGVSIREAVQFPEIREILLQNRQKMNTDDGYTILAFNMQPVTDTAIVSFPKSDVAYIVMHSDGFDQLTKAMTNPHVDLSRVYTELRKREEEDADFNAYPRFKPGDDASAMIIRVDG